MGTGFRVCKTVTLAAGWWAVACLLGVSLVGCASMEEREAFGDWSRLDRGGSGTSSGGVAGGDSREQVALTDGATLDDYLAYAALHNPGLEAAFDRWKAALERVPQARSLPDPRFSYRYFIENVETRVGPQRQAFGMSQMFPWFGKLRLRGGVAVEAARVAQSQYEAERVALFFEVKKAYYEYYYLGRAIAVVRENRDLVKYLEEVARARFKAATAGHPDVIRAQVELGKLEDRLRSLEGLRGPMAARLNALLNRSLPLPLPWPRRISEEAVGVDDRRLFDWLRTGNAELAALQHQIAQQRESIRLARRDYYPDVTVGVDYVDIGDAVMAGVSDSGNDAVSVGVSVNVPLWREKYDAGVRESLAGFGAATRTRLDRLNALEAELQAALYYFHDADRKINLYRDTLVPKAKQSIKATEAAFRNGTASFIDLVDAERVLLEFQLAFERALTDRGGRLAEIEMLVGRELVHPAGGSAPVTEGRAPDAVLPGEHNP